MPRWAAVSFFVLVAGWAAAALAAQALPAPPPPPADQRLAPGDLVSISVFETPELATDARLDASGALTMPVVGRILLAGLTPAQAETALDHRLAATYLLHPQAHVLVREFAPQPVTVLGAVKQPGVYSARSYPDLGAMLAAAGGVTDPAAESVVVTAPGVPARRVVLTALRARGAGADTPLHAGDVVRVVSGATVYVGGDVARPGAYTLPLSGMGVLQALSVAGGPTRDGRATQARIVRASASGATRSFDVNAAAILQGRVPDVPLQPFDLLYIPHSTARATVFRGLETLVATGSAIISGVIIFH